MSNEEKTQNSGEGVPSSEGKDELFHTGSILTKNSRESFYCISIIGQVEGHYILEGNQKATRYDHLIPLLVSLEESDDVDGVLIVLNTMGGDVEAGLALAELISTMSKPTVSLVLGGGHSIGVPLAVSAVRSFIVPSATMTVHPVRTSGLVIGVPQSFDYLQKMQDRIVKFIVSHSGIEEGLLRSFLSETKEMANDIGTVLNGNEAVECGLIDRVGGLSDALSELRQLSKERKAKNTLR
jgi:ATP-dependent protease ClpP protease subunit